jgi:AcrR family transcriptional regulator
MLQRIMGRRNLHSREELIALSLAAARDIVSADGVPALTMREVARRIGYTVGTLYVVFVNLDDLVVQLNEQTVIELRHALEKVNDKAHTGPQRLRLLVAAYIGFALLNTSRWRLVFEHRLPEGQKAPPTYRAHTAAIFKMVADNLRGSLKARSGTPEEVAVTLWSSVHGICVLAAHAKLQVGPGVSLQRQVDLLMDRFTDKRPARKRHQ